MGIVLVLQKWSPLLFVTSVLFGSGLISPMALHRQTYPVTQHLIQKYYEQILQSDGHNRDVVSEDAYNTAKGAVKDNQHYTVEGFRALPLESKYSENCRKRKLEDDGGGKSKQACIKSQLGGISLMSSFRSFVYGIFAEDYKKNLLIEKILAEKQHAMSYEEWKAAGIRLDGLTNKNRWKETEESSLYDYALIKDLTEKMKKCRLEKDYAHLLYLIRTNWVRNLGNMGNVNLYRHSHVGTKNIIDEYMSESKLALETLLNFSDLDDHYLLGMLQQTRRNIGRTALVLSGGGTFGLFHIGVLATLVELDMLPRVISGSSAGAIVASILSVHPKDQIAALLEQVLDTDFNIFKDDKRKTEGENLLIKISRFLKNGTWFNNEHLVNTMIEFLGDLTFREAYNRTGKILNITVSPASLFEQPRLLNNLTAPNVLIWSAVCASCSLPGIFPSTPLYEKDSKTGERREWNGSSSVKFVDGSVENDLPISRLSEMFNVDHIIACQVNIHVVPFLKLSVSCVGGDIENEFSARLKQNLTKMYNYFSEEIIHFLEIGSEIGIAKNTLTKLRSVFSQQYSGNITILPDLKMLFRINELLSNPTKEFILRETTNGARATWPKISIIENHCGQELALDKAISYLKGKLIVSASIKNPLQFSDIPVGLISNPIQTDLDKIRCPASNELDDNLVEAESTKSLLLLKENASVSNRSLDNRFIEIPGSPKLGDDRSRRRKSDSWARGRALLPSDIYTISSPTLKLQRTSKNRTIRPPMLKKSSTGHLNSSRDARKSLLTPNKKYSMIGSAPIAGSSRFRTGDSSSGTSKRDRSKSLFMKDMEEKYKRHSLDLGKASTTARLFFKEPDNGDRLSNVNGSEPLEPASIRPQDSCEGFLEKSKKSSSEDSLVTSTSLEQTEHTRKSPDSNLTEENEDNIGIV